MTGIHNEICSIEARYKGDIVRIDKQANGQRIKKATPRLLSDIVLLEVPRTTSLILVLQ